MGFTLHPPKPVNPEPLNPCELAQAQKTGALRPVQAEGSLEAKVLLDGHPATGPVLGLLLSELREGSFLEPGDCPGHHGVAPPFLERPFKLEARGGCQQDPTRGRTTERHLEDTRSPGGLARALEEGASRILQEDRDSERPCPGSSRPTRGSCGLSDSAESPPRLRPPLWSPRIVQGIQVI